MNNINNIVLVLSIKLNWLLFDCSSYKLQLQLNARLHDGDLICACTNASLSCFLLHPLWIRHASAVKDKKMIMNTTT